MAVSALRRSDSRIFQRCCSSGAAIRSPPVFQIPPRGGAMVRISRSAALLAALCVHMAMPEPTDARAVRYELDREATRISFDASATMGRFSGRAQRVNGWADVGDT